MTGGYQLPSNYRRGFIEGTRSDHDHGGGSWAFGKALWSPSTNKSGASIYRLMEEPQKGDLVVHLLDDQLAGSSRVATPLEVTDSEPPEAGPWSGRPPYFRIEIKDFTELAQPIPIKLILEDFAEEIEAELTPHRPPNYPFQIQGGTLRRTQGMYLSELTPTLFSIFQRVLALPADTAPSGTPSGRAEYAEARRRQRERYYFARNPQLTADAKAKYGHRCQICDFDFAERYGKLGENYIECHHLSPLAERPEAEQLSGTTTGLDEVRVVCSNCHRMLHRKRPAIDPDELRAMIGAADAGAQPA